MYLSLMKTKTNNRNKKNIVFNKSYKYYDKENNTTKKKTNQIKHNSFILQ